MIPIESRAQGRQRNDSQTVSEPRNGSHLIAYSRVLTNRLPPAERVWLEWGRA